MNICLMFVKTVLSVKNVCVWLGNARITPIVAIFANQLYDMLNKHYHLPQFQNYHYYSILIFLLMLCWNTAHPKNWCNISIITWHNQNVFFFTQGPDFGDGGEEVPLPQTQPKVPLPQTQPKAKFRTKTKLLG